MKLQKSSVARRVVETKNLGVAEGRRWEEREVIVGSRLRTRKGRGAGSGGERSGKKESSADSAADEEGLRCSLVAFSPLLLCKFRESFMLPLEYLVLMDGFHFPHTSASHIGTSMCNMQQCDVHLGGSHCRPELRESLSSEPNFLSHSRQSIESPKS